MTTDQVKRIIDSMVNHRPDDPNEPSWGFRTDAVQESMEAAWDLWKAIRNDLGNIVHADGKMTKPEFIVACEK